MLINADAATTPLQDKSVHTICTSPPYWSLRRYQGEQERDWPAVNYSPLPGLPEITVPAMQCALGLEPDVAAYVGHMVLIFRELYRVLRDDGVVWCVMGDSYAANVKGETRTPAEMVAISTLGIPRDGTQPRKCTEENAQYQATPRGKIHYKLNVEQGNLLMVPHRLALALQGDGWTIRNDCVWHKVAPMPESVSGWRFERCRIKIKAQGGDMSGMTYRQMIERDGGWTKETHPATRSSTEYQPCPGCPKCAPTDGWILRRGSWRHTRAHEFVLMCVKSMGYWSNQEVVRESYRPATIERLHYSAIPKKGKSKDNILQDGNGDMLESGVGRYTAGLVSHEHKQGSGCNPRSVLKPSPESYSGQHFAVFPTSLIAPLIRATTPARCCPTCGAGWSPMVEKERHWHREQRDGRLRYGGRPDDNRNDGRATITTNILSYRPTCDCNAPHRWEFLGTIKDNKPMHRCARCGIGDWTEPAQQPCKEPGLVFDPFLGSGTTARVAKELGLRWVGADLSFEYLDLQAKVRTGTGVPSDWREGLPMFADGQYELCAEHPRGLKAADVVVPEKAADE